MNVIKQMTFILIELFIQSNFHWFQIRVFKEQVRDAYR